MTVINKDDVILIKKAAKYLDGYKWNIFVIALLEITDIVMDIIQPLIWGYLVADVCRLQFESVTKYLLLLISLMVVQISGDYLEAYCRAKTNENIEKDIRNDIYINVLNSPMKAFDKMGAGEVLDHLEGDVVSVSNVFTERLIGLVINLIKAIIISVVVIKINYIIAVLIFLFFPMTLAAMKVFGKCIRKTDEQLRKNTDRYYSFVQDTMTCIREIKSLGLKQKNANLFDKVIDKNKILQIKIYKIQAALSSTVQGLNFALQTMLFVTGIHFIVEGELRVELFVALISYAEMVSYSLMQVAQVNPELQETFVSIERIFKILEGTEYGKEQFGIENIDKTIDSIRFENVSFSYNGTPVLRNISFEFKHGKNILCGKSGSGKTTIIDLILRLYDVDSGEIILNETNMVNISEQSIRRGITVVTQEPNLFNGDLRYNIALNNETISDDEILGLCRAVCLDDLIDSLPEKLNTKLTNLGADFSVGQKQRIAMARSIASLSEVIIFDESTTGLDGYKKKKLIDFINDHSKDHMVIIVDHRMAGVGKADNVVFIENGQVKGAGLHEKLLTENIDYRKLYTAERL